MKPFFAFLLLLLVVVTTVTPCCLKDNCVDVETGFAGNTGDEEEGGTCSPFFSCATCPGFVFTPSQVQLTAPLVAGLKHETQWYTSHPQPVYSPFWQPPRA